MMDFFRKYSRFFVLIMLIAFLVVSVVPMLSVFMVDRPRQNHLAR